MESDSFHSIDGVMTERTLVALLDSLQLNRHRFATFCVNFQMYSLRVPTTWAGQIWCSITLIQGMRHLSDSLPVGYR